MMPEVLTKETAFMDQLYLPWTVPQTATGPGTSQHPSNGTAPATSWSTQHTNFSRAPATSWNSTTPNLLKSTRHILEHTTHQRFQSTSHILEQHNTQSSREVRICSCQHCPSDHPLDFPKVKSGSCLKRAVWRTPFEQIAIRRIIEQ